MLTEQDKVAIIETASQYGAHRVLLFGSSMESHQEGKDIDIAVEGIPPGDFFKFYGDLILKVSKPLDVVDLSQDNLFTQIVWQEGIILYDNTEETAYS